MSLKNWLRLLATLAPVSCTYLSLAADETPISCREAVESRTFLGQRYDFGLEIPAPHRDRFNHAGRESVRYVRLHLVSTNVSPGDDWTLTLRAPDYRVLQTFSSKAFGSKEGIWTDRLPFGEILLDVSGRSADSAMRIRLTEYVVMPKGVEGPTLYSTQSAEPQWAPLYESDREDVRRWGDSTALLILSWEQETWTCSGFVVTKDLLLTNWHCGAVIERAVSGLKERKELFWNPQICRDARIDFSWDEDSFSHDFSCSEVVAKNEFLDYAVLRISPLSANSAPIPVRLSEQVLEPGADAILIHHPLALPKMVSTECTLGQDVARSSWRGDRPGTDFTHLCDTEGGSSGAPVFDKNGKVIGLHHHGFAIDPKTCARLDHLNKAVSITAILNDLTSLPNALHEIEAAQPDLARRSVP